MAYIHLRTHTEYSVVDGTLRIDEMVAAAAADGQAALAVTDLSNLFGAIKFYSAARKAGVKPLLGVDVWLEPEGGEKQPSRLLLLAQNRAGYLNLCSLLSRAWTVPSAGGAPRTHAALAWSWLAEAGDGLIALSGGACGAVGQALLARDGERAGRIAVRLAALFPGRFYIELQRAGLATDEAHVRAAVPLAAQLGLPVAATHPAQFLAPDDYDAHEARVCVAEGETLVNPRRVKRFSREQYFKTQAQMEALFADLPSALANTVEIARRCSLSLVLGRPQLPAFPTPPVDGVTLDDEAYFRHLSHRGLASRLEELYPDAAKRERERQRYVERLDFEIATILKMGFPGYFLIVADFINWAKENGCPVGPGRGSGAGSLVAYALGITGVDPLRYQLLFERFLNPERVSMPDFDIDFCQANRDRVIDYVKQRYGRDAVSQIATFGTMAAKAALRDIGRVLGMGYGHVDSVAKLVPAPPGKVVTLARVPERPDPGLIYARRENPEIEAREQAEEEVAELLVAGHARRGHRAQRRHACRRRAHRAGQDHRLLPALHAAGQRLGGEPVRQGRRRGDRAREVRLPRPRHADHPRARQGVHRRAPAEARRLRLRPPAARRREGLPPVLRRPHRVGVPVRKRRHAAHAQGCETEPHRGPGGAERDVPPRPDGEHPDLLPAQARQGGGELSASAARDGARRDLRRDGLPGAGDAGRAGARRLLARRRRPAAPRDGQEEGRRDGPPPRDLPHRRGGQGHRGRRRRRGVRPDGEVRRLRLQQVACRRLLAAGLSHGLDQGALHGRVLRRQHDRRA